MERSQIFPSVDDIGNKKAENNQNDHSRREIKSHGGAGTAKSEPLSCDYMLLQKAFLHLSAAAGSLSHPYKKHLIFWFPCPVPK